MATITQTQYGELHYIVKFDNTGGPAAQHDLVTVQNTQTFSTVFGSPSSTETNALTRWFQSQAKGVSDFLGIFSTQQTGRALLSLQSLSPGWPAPPIKRQIGAGGVRFYIDIPAGQQVWFIWGMTASIDGGFALSGGEGASGGIPRIASAGLLSLTINTLGPPETQVGLIQGANLTPPGVFASALFTANLSIENTGAGPVTVLCAIGVVGSGTVFTRAVATIPVGATVPVALCGQVASFTDTADFEVTVEMNGAPGDSVLVNPPLASSNIVATVVVN